MTCVLNSNLSRCVYEETRQYLECLQGSEITGIYQMVMQEVERPLLRLIMECVRSNQSEAAKMLGLSRGTLRKKLAQYDLL